MFRLWFTQHWSTVRKLILLKAAGVIGEVWKTITGAIVSFTTAIAAPVRSLVVAIAPVQAGSGDPSPDNVRPITGWDGANVYHYDAYTGTIIPITFPTPPGTVYGGTLDVTNGVLTVTMASVDMGTLNWTYAGNIFRCANIGNVLNNDAQAIPNLLCSSYKALSRAALISMQFVGITINTGVYGEIWVTDSAYDSARSFKTAMSGVQLVYELATPQTYQLTPQEVQTLQGQNTIWADAGDVTVEYRES